MRKPRSRAVEVPEKPLLAAPKPEPPPLPTNAAADLARYDRMFVAQEGMPHAGTAAERFALRDELAAARAEALESGQLDRAKARMLAAKRATEEEVVDDGD